MNKLDDIFTRSKNIEDYTAGYFEYVCQLLKNIDKKDVALVSEELEKASRNGNMIYLIGNGGSAATSLHFAQDLEKGTATEGISHFKTESLVGNVSYLTAVGNDTSFENIFSDQLKAKLMENDVVIGISASGNSPNLIKAFEYAKSKKARIIAFLGFDGGKMKVLADVKIHVKTDKGEYGPVEDIHMILFHIIATFFTKAKKK